MVLSGPQDLGEDFTFESDPQALQSILDHRGVTSKINTGVDGVHDGGGYGGGGHYQLTPVNHLPKRLKRFEDR